MSTKISFNPVTADSFYKVVRSRVDTYFKTRQISPYANAEMIGKTIYMLALYLVPFGLILTGWFNDGWMLILSAVMGTGLAGIGMGVQHDANHGAYSPSTRLNRLLGYTLNIIGANAFTWRLKHNTLHHSYTNLQGWDEDIETYQTMTLTPREQPLPAHRFQHLYAIFIYGTVTLEWCVSRDFLDLHRYWQIKGLLKQAWHYHRELIRLIISKVIYFGLVLVMPMLWLPLPWWKVLLGFATLHFTAGLILATVFQLAHVVEKTCFPAPDKQGHVDQEWAVHQLLTTANFSRQNRVLSWLIGGLNYQIEHHLFPYICHVHYPHMTDIVKQTAQEFGLPYHEYPSFWSALASHMRTIRRLGMGIPVQPLQE